MIPALIRKFLEARATSAPSDIGMVLVMFVDAASGEVVLVVYEPLLD